MDQNDSFQQYDETDFAYFPRSEYCTRFVGTSAFEMSQPKYWGSYFRTTRDANSDRISHVVNKTQKTYRNVAVRTSRKQERHFYFYRNF